MRTAMLLPGVLMVITCSVSADQKYDFDASHALVRFAVKMVGIGDVEGRFDETDAAITYNESDLTKSSVTALVHVRSIDTGDKERDDHLRTADFFDAERFPAIRFQSSRIEKQGDDWIAVGDLTIHGVTHQINLPFKWVQKKHVDPFGNPRIGFEAHTTLKRSDYGIKGPAFWGSAISDEVDILLRVSARIYDWDTVDPQPDKGKKSILSEMSPLFAQSDPRAISHLAEIESTSNSQYDLGEWPFHVLVRRLNQHGKMKEALEASKIFAKACPKSSTALDDLADAYEATGDRKQAFVFYQKAVELGPFDADAAENLRIIAH